MTEANKIAFLSIPVPYRSSGNIIIQKEVGFHIYKDGKRFSATPVLSPDEFRLANLPQELMFEYTDGKAASLRGFKDGNMHVINDLVEQLKARQLID